MSCLGRFTTSKLLWLTITERICKITVHSHGRAEDICSAVGDFDHGHRSISRQQKTVLLWPQAARRGRRRWHTAFVAAVNRRLIQPRKVQKKRHRTAVAVEVHAVGNVLVASCYYCIRVLLCVSIIRAKLLYLWVVTPPHGQRIDPNKERPIPGSHFYLSTSSHRVHVIWRVQLYTAFVDLCSLYVEAGTVSIACIL